MYMDVSQVDFAQGLWTELIEGRRDPSGQAERHVLMKMDIEGAEFAVVPAMLKSGLLCRGSGIDAFTIETHERIMEHDNRSFTPWAATRLAILEQADCSPSELIELDDEAYVYEDVALDY
eukprot:gnl/TRDRNA2_/TRDRNA2_176800_c0_seq1.p2 gnl/TRDRNA2_/TRDRNA2_176800_c0~~gnl/TRDRNA2_/TRDRNA2_176800_c0_seq1.p2  ORF type:complete len:120 (-),score=18.83 gnl/TRDRNA2_/TRDRNA2_176800_c0_seq1:79-438(-)